MFEDIMGNYMFNEDGSITTREEQLNQIKEQLEADYPDEVERLNASNELIKIGVITDEEREMMFEDIMGNYMFNEDGSITTREEQLKEMKANLTNLTDAEKENFLNNLKETNVITEEEYNELMQ